MKLLIFSLLILTGVCIAEKTAENVPFNVPEEAVRIDPDKISFPLAHKSKKANLIFQKEAGDNDFCVISANQAIDLVGSQYKVEPDLKTILVKWSFLEPKDTKAVDSVSTYAPSVSSMDGVIYVVSNGVDIGDVAEVADGVFILQVQQLPNKVIHKLRSTGW